MNMPLIMPLMIIGGLILIIGTYQAKAMKDYQAP